ncbi:MAG: preprotein translocase subunit YajC [Opitutaceae bacterium]
MQNVTLSALAANPVIAQSQGTGGSGPMMGQLLFFGLFFAAMWFLLIAPQRKKQKKHQEMIKSLTTGDEVLTSGGIYGIITNVKDDRVVVRIAEGTKVEISRGFITSVEKKVSAS